MRIVGLFNQNGVKILAGTDTPIGYLTPGFSLHKELELLVQAGLSPTEALRAATVAPAEIFNLESKIGTLDVGKLADIVILNNNPLTDIRHTQDIYRVISKGVIY
jgi:imidazolonepropionase-like amidohydrolase